MESGEERVLRLLADARNRTILTLLDDADGPLHVTELAGRFVAHEAAVLESAEYEAEVDRARCSMHHEDLPKLADAGLVEYDPDRNVVTGGNSTALDVEWLDGGRVDELLSRFGTASGTDWSASGADGNGIGVVEGRDDVIERGRRLADEADEELFLMYVSDELLEADCLPHAENAIERGVDIYLGSKNPDVRDLARRELPDVTLWEPQLDWLSAPSRYPKVGRLVLADRTKLMLALLDEPGTGGTSTETAMVGEGERNPLVVLVRELLGPRLDHLDYQSEQFRTELPFES